MAHLGFDLEAAGWRWNVSPFLVASIAGAESSFGANRCGYNVFGWNSCNGDSFDSFNDAINTVTRGLRVNYINRWHLRTVEAIGRTYCGTPNPATGFCMFWVPNVAWYMRHRFGASLSVEYPR